MNLPFWPFYVGDYLADTMHLTTTEHGAYLLLLMAYWKKQAPLPDSDTDLATITRLSPSDWQATRFRVAGFFKIEGGKWVHDRLNRDIERHTSRHLAMSQAAMATNAKRWPKSPSVSPSDKKTSPSVSEPEPEPEVQSTPLPPNGEVRVRLGKLFHRKPDTRWSDNEVKALKKLIPIPEEEFQLVEKYYTSNIPKNSDFRRHDLQTLLNNWTGEVDRARNFKQPCMF